MINFCFVFNFKWLHKYFEMYRCWIMGFKWNWQKGWKRQTIPSLTSKLDLKREIDSLSSVEEQEHPCVFESIMLTTKHSNYFSTVGKIFGSYLAKWIMALFNEITRICKRMLYPQNTFDGIMYFSNYDSSCRTSELVKWFFFV